MPAFVIRIDVEYFRTGSRWAASLQETVGLAGERIVERLIGEGEVGARIVAFLVLTYPARGLREGKVVVGHARAGYELEGPIEYQTPAEVFVESSIDEFLEEA